MGKWTAEYYDDMLGAKMRSLVSGAIKRARLEKAEPTITYEAFVEDLDRGDSFTTSLIEVLVKEVAERRQRQHASDRGLIGDRTARSLRRLSSPTSIYRDRLSGRHTRRGVDLADYLSQPPDEFDMDEDEDELGPYGTFVPVVEGTRLNSDLYDAYRSQHSWSSSSTPYLLSFSHHSPPISSVPSPDPVTNERVLPPLVDGSPPTTTTTATTTTRSSGVWPLSSSSGANTGGYLHSTLSRQPAIRRGGRSSLSDFNEFTAARRNSTRLLRQIAIDEANRDTPDSSAPSHNGTADGPGSGSPAPREEHPVARSGSVPGSFQARRFFPFGRTRRFEIIPTPRPASSTSDDWYFPPHSGWTTTGSSGLGSGIGERPLGEEEHGSGNGNGEERTQAPRLRRGGLRAPESMLARNGSPPIGVPTIAFPTPEELQRVTTAAVASASASASVASVPAPVPVPTPPSVEMTEGRSEPLTAAMGPGLGETPPTHAAAATGGRSEMAEGV